MLSTPLTLPNPHQQPQSSESTTSANSDIPLTNVRAHHYPTFSVIPQRQIGAYWTPYVQLWGGFRGGASALRETLFTINKYSGLSAFLRMSDSVCFSGTNRAPNVHSSSIDATFLYWLLLLFLTFSHLSFRQLGIISQINYLYNCPVLGFQGNRVYLQLPDQNEICFGPITAE